MSKIDRIKAFASRSELQLGMAAAARLARNKLDALELFRPTDYQEQVVLSDASEILVKGGTRSGKSVIVAAMVAAYLRNKPLTFSDGRRVNVREESWSSRPVTAWLVGLQLDHIGQTLHRLLCRAGAFDIVRDAETGLWRAWQPGFIPGDDKIPDKDRKPAPPMIPPSEIADTTWENKKEFKFTSLIMKNGSVAYGFASSGSVKRGDPVNIIWVDEEIQDSAHYPEWQSRISDRKGRIIWTSWPALKTPALLRMNRRAAEQREEVNRGDRKKADVVCFTFIGSKSPYIDDEEKRKRAEGWTEEERMARDFGEFATGSLVVYPEFDRRYHAVDYGHDSPLNDKVTETMRRLNWNVPADWCVDLILDPGTNRPALIWGAIPPREFWDNSEPYYIIYRELAVPRIDAFEIARRVKSADPGRRYARFIIDRKAGDQTPMGFAHRVSEQYSLGFRKESLRSQLTGDMFLPSDHVWISRSMKLRSWMRGREGCPRPQLRIVAHMCPTLIRQLEETLKDVAKEDVKDAIAPGQVHDVLDVAEYWAGSDPVFVSPPAGPATPYFIDRAAEDKQAFQQLTLGSRSDKTPDKIVLGL